MNAIVDMQDYMGEMLEANTKRREKEEVERRKSNPFLKDLRIETKRKRAGGSVESVNFFDDNGDVVATELNRVEYVDKDSFVKVFASWLPVFFQLNHAGFKVWYLIAMELGQGEVEVRLHHKDAIRKIVSNAKGKEGAISRDTFYRGVKNLIEIGLIAKQEEPGRADYYWVNPSAFFNGDRVKFAVTYANKAKAEGIEEGEGPKVVKQTKASRKRLLHESGQLDDVEDAMKKLHADLAKAS